MTLLSFVRRFLLKRFRSILAARTLPPYVIANTVDGPAGTASEHRIARVALLPVDI